MNRIKNNFLCLIIMRHFTLAENFRQIASSRGYENKGNFLRRKCDEYKIYYTTTKIHGHTYIRNFKPTYLLNNFKKKVSNNDLLFLFLSNQKEFNKFINYEKFLINKSRHNPFVVTLINRPKRFD